MSPGIGGSDYINASFIDVRGYCHCHSACHVVVHGSFVNVYRELSSASTSLFFAVVIPLTLIT